MAADTRTGTVRLERGQLDALTAAIREVAAEVRELREALGMKEWAEPWSFFTCESARETKVGGNWPPATHPDDDALADADWLCDIAARMRDGETRASDVDALERRTSLLLLFARHLRGGGETPVGEYANHNRSPSFGCPVAGDGWPMAAFVERVEFDRSAWARAKVSYPLGGEVVSEWAHVSHDAANDRVDFYEWIDEPKGGE